MAWQIRGVAAEARPPGICKVQGALVRPNPETGRNGSRPSAEDNGISGLLMTTCCRALLCSMSLFQAVMNHGSTVIISVKPLATITTGVAGAGLPPTPKVQVFGGGKRGS